MGRDRAGDSEWETEGHGGTPGDVCETWQGLSLASGHSVPRAWCGLSGKVAVGCA